MLTVNGEPTSSQAFMSRPRRRHIVSCGGSNAHCCTQLASIPVSASPRRAVTTNRPLGMRPSAAASPFCRSSLIRRSFLQEFGHQRLDLLFVVRLLLALELAGEPAVAVEDEDG